jgi:hypothetical protein
LAAVKRQGRDNLSKLREKFVEKINTLSERYNHLLHADRRDTEEMLRHKLTLVARDAKTPAAFKKALQKLQAILTLQVRNEKKRVQQEVVALRKKLASEETAERNAGNRVDSAAAAEMRKETEALKAKQASELKAARNAMRSKLLKAITANQEKLNALHERELFELNAVRNNQHQALRQRELAESIELTRLQAAHDKQVAVLRAKLADISDSIPTAAQQSAAEAAFVEAMKDARASAKRAASPNQKQAPIVFVELEDAINSPVSLLSFSSILTSAKDNHKHEHQAVEKARANVAAALERLKASGEIQTPTKEDQLYRQRLAQEEDAVRSQLTSLEAFKHEAVELKQEMGKAQQSLQAASQDEEKIAKLKEASEKHVRSLEMQVSSSHAHAAKPTKASTLLSIESMELSLQQLQERVEVTKKRAQALSKTAKEEDKHLVHDQTQKDLAQQLADARQLVLSLRHKLAQKEQTITKSLKPAVSKLTSKLQTLRREFRSAATQLRMDLESLHRLAQLIYQRERDYLAKERKHVKKL